MYTSDQDLGFLSMLVFTERGPRTVWESVGLGSDSGREETGRGSHYGNSTHQMLNK